MSQTGGIRWPKKTQQASHPFLDSTRWDEFPFRDDDIVIATWAKSGSTWLQQIVGQLIFEGPEGGGKTFIHKGTNGRWRDVLTATDIQKYENSASENLSPDCASWLATGQLP